MGRWGDPRERVLANVLRVEGDACWPWLGQVNNKGYGMACIGGRKRAAHVVVYELLVGAVPDGLELDHLCRVPLCVNPDHLEPVTHAVNMRRAGDAQTACRKASHDWSIPRNVYTEPKTGRRRCRECARIADRTDRRRAQRRAYKEVARGLAA
jgi:hypothetical protein